jgi:hypothetical protein
MSVRRRRGDCMSVRIGTTLLCIYVQPSKSSRNRRNPYRWTQTSGLEGGRLLIFAILLLSLNSVFVTDR